MLNPQTKIIAITGGSGSGKTFLAERLQRMLGPIATRLCLDDFYLDHSNLPPSRRAKLNFDHPRAIDWPLAETVLRECRAARPTELPRYDFKTHTRLAQCDRWTPSPLLLVDGLWLLWRPGVRALLDLSIFLECPTQLRLERRLARDGAERNRAPGSVREQFWRSVAPMHERYVAPQADWADIILHQPSSEAEVAELVDVIRRILSESEAEKANGAQHVNGTNGANAATALSIAETISRTRAGRRHAARDIADAVEREDNGLLEPDPSLKS